MAPEPPRRDGIVGVKGLRPSRFFRGRKVEVWNLLSKLEARREKKLSLSLKLPGLRHVFLPPRSASNSIWSTSESIE
jgi:hypothetical protein